MNTIQDMKVEFSKENKSLKKTQTEIKSEIKKNYKVIQIPEK